jgi:hypothetical protein
VTTWGDVSKHNLIGQCGGKLVTAYGQLFGDPTRRCGELGKDKQPVSGERLLPVCWRTHARKSTGKTNDHRLPAAQQNTEAVPLHRRMEPANYASALIPPAHGLIVGGEDHITGAAGRAEKRRLSQGEQIQIPKRGELRWCLIPQAFMQACRTVGVTGHGGHYLPPAHSRGSPGAVAATAERHSSSKISSVSVLEKHALKYRMSSRNSNERVGTEDARNMSITIVSFSHAGK